MNVNWGGYTPYRPRIGLLQEAPRSDARREYDDFISQKAERIEQLRILLEQNAVSFGDSDADLQAVDGWFRANVEGDPERHPRLLPIWYSVVNDIGAHLGEILIGRHPNLEWRFFTWGKKDASYQRPVIMGFAATQNSKYNVDFDAAIVRHAHRCVSLVEVEPDFFLRALRYAERSA